MGKLTKSTSDIQRILDESDGLKQHVESELATLKGSGEGSISAAVEAGVHRVLGGASEAYDTLKEIEDYIEKDEAGAVALTQSIARLETEKVSKEDIDSALSTTSENPVQNKVITVALNEKVDKVSGKGLSTNDYTTSEKDKLASLENYDDSEIKSQLTELSERIDNLPKDDEFDAEGNYPLLHVGTADTAIDLAGRGESVPAEFGFRASGGKSIKDGRAYIKRIKGNSVVWNQTMEKPYTKFFTNRVTYSIENNVVRCVVNSIAYPFVGIYSDKVEKQHTYLVAFKYLGNKNAYVEGGIEIQGQGINIAANKLTQFTAIKKASKAAGIGFVMSTTIESMEIGDTFEIHDINVYDLTKMFGAGNEPTTIEDFYARKPIVEDEYAYNEGEVIHCNTESIKSVGDNAWDEQWENGTFDITSGEAIDVSWVMVQIRSKNPLPVLPNEEYYVSMGKGSIWVIFFDKEGNVIESPAHNGVTAGNAINISNSGRFKTPTNAAFLIFYCTEDYGSTYNHDILISLYHSGWKAEKDDQYQPYWQDTLPLPIISKYFPQGMKKAGTAHDEIRYNKATQKWEAVKRIGEVDLGTLDWILTSQMYFRALLPSDSIAPTNTDYNGFICAKYERVDFNLIYGQRVASPCFGIPANNPVCCVSDSSYTDAATFKAAMQGVIFYYELAEPIVTELAAEDQNFRDYYNVADFGTEQSQSSVPSAPFSADIIYQFNAVDMIREHELEITELQKVIATMQAQLTALTNGGQ